MNINLLFNYKSLLVYIPTVLFCIIVLWGFLSGLRRGFRKSIILFINMLIALGLSCLVFYLIFGKNFDEQIVKYADQILGAAGQSLKDILQTKSSYDTLTGYLNEVFTEIMPESYIATTSIITIVSTLMAIVESVLKLAMIIVLIVFYHIIKFILYIIYLIFFREGRKKKKMNRKYEEGVSQKRYKRRRLLGSLVGFIRATAVAIVLFSFIGSFTYILSGGYYSKDTEELVLEFNDQQYDVTEYYDIVNRYGTVGIGKLLESVQNSNDVPLYLLVADYMTKGDYTITNSDGTQTTGSLYGREELAPIVGLVKELALTAVDYGFDTSKTSDTDYLINFLSKDNTIDGMAFCDKLDGIVDKYNFGTYTIFLGQCLVKAVADNAVATTGDSSSFSSQLLNILFNGDNKINASDVVTNKNINAVLHYVINLASNYKSINNLLDSLQGNSNEEQLVYGIKKNANISDKDVEIVEEILASTQNLFNELEFFNTDKTDALLTDVIILVLEKVAPGYSLEGVKEKDSQYSLYNISWRENIDTLFDYMLDFVKYVNEKDAYTMNQLINAIVTDLESTESVGYKLVFSILESDILGAALNARGFKDTMNNALSNFSMTIPDSIVLGNYRNSEGEIVHGEIYNLVANVSTKVKVVYNIFSNKEYSTKQKLEQMFNEDNNLVPMLKNTFDDTNASYSKLLHYMVSDLLLNIETLGLSFDIYVPETARERIDANTLIVSSKELVNVCDLISTIAPNLFADELDYSTLLTSENIQRFMTSQIMRSTIAITAYTQIHKMEGVGEYMPSSLALDTTENINANMDKWVQDEGELHYIVDALSTGNLMNSFFQNEGESLDMVSLVLDMDSNSMSSAMKSNVLNTIVTAKISAVSLGEVSILVPTEAKLAQLDGLDRIKPEEMVTVLEVIKASELDAVINAEEGADKSKIMIEKILTLDSATRSNLANSNILNATVTAYLETMTISNGDNEYNILLPKVSLMDKSVSMIKEADFSLCLDAINQLLNGQYDFKAINFNRILDSTVINSVDNSVIISATMINLLVGMIDGLTGNTAKYITMPEVYKDNDLVNNYNTTRWTEQAELKKVLNSLGLLGISFDENNKLVMDEKNILKLSIDCSLENSSLNQILNSEVLYTSISKVIMELESLYVVDALKQNLIADPTLDPELNNTVIKRAEVIELFSSIEKLIGKTKIEEGVLFSELSNYVTIESLEDNEKLNSTSINGLISSVIIETKLAQVITDSAEGKVLVTKTLDYSSTDNADNIYKWLSIEKNGNANANNELSETHKLVDALGILKLFDMLKSGSTKTFDINGFTELPDDQLDQVLSSELIHATFVDQFYEKTLTNNSIKLPEAYQDAIPSSDTPKLLSDEGGEEPAPVVDCSETIANNFWDLKIVKENEIKAIVKAISVLGLSIDNPSISTNTILDLNDPAYPKSETEDDGTGGGEPDPQSDDGEDATPEEPIITKLDVVNGSDIIWFTLSEKLLSNDNLSIPTAEVTYKEGNDVYATKAEVSNMISALEALKIDSLEAAIGVNSILSADVATVVKSYILWLTMSEKILATSDLTTDASIIVKSNDTTLSASGDTEKYIKKQELINLVAGLNILEITTINGSFSPNSIKGKDMLKVCESVILWVNISSKVNSISQLEKDDSIYVQVENSTSGNIFISSTELNNLAIGFSELDLTDLSTIEVSKINGAKMDKVLESTMLWLTISRELKNIEGLTQDTQVYTNIDNVTPNPSGRAIFKSEIEYFSAGVKSLDANDFGSISVDMIKIADMTIVCKSYILWLNISEKVMDANLLLKDTSIRRNRDGSNNELGVYIDKDELDYLQKGVASMNISLSGETFNVNGILNANMTTVCDSKILWLTISQNIITNSAILKEEALYTNNSDSPVTNGSYIQKDELKYFVAGLKLLGITTISNGFATDSILKSTSSMTDVCKSYILWKNMSNQLVNSLTVPKSIRYTYENSQSSTGDYVEIAEITNLIASAKSLEMENFNGFNINKIINSTIDDLVWNSKIISATATDAIMKVGTLKVVGSVLMSGLSVSSDRIITKTELSDFMTAVKSLNLESLDSISVDLAIVKTNYDSLISSEIIRATISYEMLSAGQIVNTSMASSDTYYSISSNSEVSGSCYLIAKDHIKTFIDTASSLGMTSYSIAGASVSADTIDIICQSEILKLSYNDVITVAIALYNYQNLGNQVVISYKDPMTLVKYSNGSIITEQSSVILSEQTITAYAERLKTQTN